MPLAWSFHASYGANNYELQWQDDPLKPGKNKNGITGFARVVCRTYNPEDGEGWAEGSLQRVHLCSFTPCTAIRPDHKYGVLGPPTHIRPTSWRPPADEAAVKAQAMEAAAMAGDAVEANAVEATVVAADATVVAEPPPVSAGDGQEDSSSDSSSESSEESTAAADAHAVTAEPAVAATLPPPPEEAKLRKASAAIPEPPPPPSSSTCTELPVLSPDVPAFAVSSLIDKIMALGRTINCDRGYVGHSAFVLFGLLYQCRPCIWEGDVRIDLIDVYANWAIERCQQVCAVDVVS